MHFIKTGCNAKNVIISGFQNHLQNYFSMHISLSPSELVYFVHIALADPVQNLWAISAKGNNYFVLFATHYFTNFRQGKNLPFFTHNTCLGTVF